MTDRERAIVMAYTGVAMLVGDKLDVFYRYAEELYGRPVFSHEFASLDLKEKSKPDFIKLCSGEIPKKPAVESFSYENAVAEGFKKGYEEAKHYYEVILQSIDLKGPRYCVQHPTTKMWRCFSTFVEDWVTEWMPADQYRSWWDATHPHSAPGERAFDEMPYSTAMKIYNNARGGDQNELP